MSAGSLKKILALASEQNASDIHIKPDSYVVFRISGVLVDCDFVTENDCVRQFVNTIANDDQLQVCNKTGDVDLSYVAKGIGRFRVNIHKQRGGLAINMRLVKSEILNFDQLGLPSQIAKIPQFERGIVFVTGTTGSGKSTTLAAIIEYINTHYRKHIITVEDPIEYEFSDKKSFIEQREVGLDTVSFDSAFVHSLRQDPDIIVIGEMRSRDSFDAALKAADSGHLIFSTLHTLNASQSINRILDFYDASEHKGILSSLSSSLASIVSQRLIPKVAKKGVVPAVEILLNTPVVENILKENKLSKLAPAIENSRNEGMQSFNQALVDLVNQKVISEKEAIKFATNPEALKMQLKGVFLGSENKILGS
jgi:twitching motility protein PilT